MSESPGELSAARSLHRWLRRAALSAIPLAGLAGCGSDCHRPDFDTTVPVDGGVPWATGSQHSPAECAPYCGTGRSDTCYALEVTGCVAASPSSVTCGNHYRFCYPGTCGRAPAGLKPGGRVEQPSLVAAHLADAASLEGAAVFAFQALERELLAHEAPAHLVARARSAQRDEARHHAAMSKLARRSGARVPAVDVEPVGVRSLVEMAVENAVEGCVRETYGAAVAAYQGEWAADRSIRRAMRSIAIDEAEHASLGWAVDAWARSRISPAQLALVEAARQGARAGLVARTQQPVPPELVATAGIPDAPSAAMLTAALAPLWS
ncbi:MAG: hypothetical protein NVS4B10_05720 [Myxococcales bacterium]